MSMHDQRSIDLMERHATRTCHMGTDNNSTTISSPSSLRKMLLSRDSFKGEGGGVC
jgi:hypothetical protein